RRIQSEIGRHDRFFDLLHHALFPRLHRECTSILRGHVGSLIQRNLAAVVVDRNVVEKAGAGPTRPYLGEIVAHYIGGLVHALLCISIYFVDHCLLPVGLLSTSVPTSSAPMTIFIKSPARLMSNTLSGMPLSRHRTMAVVSITARR